MWPADVEIAKGTVMTNTQQQQDGMGKCYVVYVCMLLIYAIELFVTYRHPGAHEFLGTLLILAFIGAALGVLYFMNLASENRNAMIGFAVFTLFVLAAINYGWTDSFRILLGVPYAK
jgi:heme/copper-type cytochrome/quinol oxidase subunit 4